MIKVKCKNICINNIQLSYVLYNSNSIKSKKPFSKGWILKLLTLVFFLHNVFSHWLAIKTAPCRKMTRTHATKPTTTTIPRYEKKTTTKTNIQLHSLISRRSGHSTWIINVPAAANYINKSTNRANGQHLDFADVHVKIKWANMSVHIQRSCCNSCPHAVRQSVSQSVPTCAAIVVAIMVAAAKSLLGLKKHTANHKIQIIT